MAVEIPVYVDIQGAFDRAVREIPKELPKLEKVISSNALKMKIDVGGTDMSVRKILTDTTLSANELEKALQSIRRAFNDAVSKGANKSRTSANVNNLAKAYGLLEQRIKGVYNANTVAMMRLEDPIAKVNAKLTTLRTKLAGLTVGTDSFNKINYEIKIQEDRLRKLNNQMEMYRLQSIKANATVASSTASTTKSLASQSTILSQIKSLAASYVSVFAAGRFIKNVREVTAEFELQRVALGGIIQDTNRAESLFRQIKAAAIESPFQIKDLVSYTKQLSAYRVETDNLFDVTMKLADVSAGLGVDMGRLILAYGQVRAASVLRGQELRQFTEAGIPLVDLLAKKFQELNGRMVSTAEVFELISKRAVPFEMISDIFEDMTNKGGTFYKMQEKQAETLAGQWSNLRDALSIMYDEIGNTTTVHNAMTRLISDAKYLMQNWRSVATVIGAVVSAITVKKVSSLFFSKLTLDTALAEKATLALARAQKLEAAQQAKSSVIRGVTIKQLRSYSTLTMEAAAAQTIFGRTAKRLAAMFVGGGWVGLLVTALGLIVGKLISANQEANRLNKELSKIATDGALSINRSVAGFVRLAEAAVDAADGSNEQNEALAELERTYGDIIPSQNLQIDKLRELRGNYDSLTDAIRQKINMQIREQKINAATDYYSGQIQKGRKKAKNLLEQYGLDKEQINAVLDEVQTLVDSGMMGIGDTITSRAHVVEDVIKRLTGLEVQLVDAYRYGSEKQFSRAVQSKAAFALSDLVDTYVDLNEQTDSINREMNSVVGTMGVYSKAWEDLKKEIDGVTVSEKEFGDKYSFAFKKEKIRREVEIMANAIEEAFAETGIDISSAFDPKGTIDFERLNKFAEGSTKWGLQSYVKHIQDSYEAIVSTNKMVSVVESKFHELSASVGLTMDDVQGYLLRGEKDMRTYTKELGDDLQEAKDKVSDLGLRAEQAQKYSIIPAPTDEEMTRANAVVDFLEALISWLEAYEKKTKGSSVAYVQDPFIKNMQDRMKFMKDFQKGYEDLENYMSSSAAETKEASVMLTRGLSMGLSADEQKRAAKDLSQWYEDAMERTFKYLQTSKGVSGTRQEFLRRQITGNTNDDKMLKDFQDLLQSLFDAKTDFDTSQATKNIEDALKTISERVKRSETARDFYNDILDLTGDDALATTLSVSVYGGIGEDFKDRIRNQLVESLNSLDAESFAGLEDPIQKAFESGDYEYLVQNIEKVPEKLREVVKTVATDAEKYNADVSKSYAKLLLKFDELKQQQVNITAQAAKDMADIEAGLALEIEGIQKREADPARQRDLIAAATARAEAAKGAVSRQEKLDLSRLERNYRMFFSSVGVISEETAQKVAREQKQMITDQFIRGEKTLAQYKRELNEIDKQLEKYTNNTGFLRTFMTSGFDGLVDKVKEFGDGLVAIADGLELVEKDGALAFSDDDKKYIDMVGKILGGDTFGVKGRKNTAEKLIKKIGEISATPEEFSQNLKEALGEAAGNADNFATKMSQGISAAGFWVTNVSTLIKELDAFNNEMDSPAWLDALATTATWTLGVGGDSAWDRLSYLNEYATSGFEKLAQGNIIGAIADNIKGLYGMWGPNIKKINRQIKEQDDVLDDLKYQYGRLEVAIDKAFGNDYVENYTRELKNLEAQQAAYLRQAELERSKAKAADKEKIKDYENAARDTADQIADMQSQLSEFFAGTDLTSAATEFAEAWIEAYKQFGSTTDAMKEKFQGMIESMITNSLAAKLMQSILQPLFDEIDQMALSGGELSASEIGQIAAEAPDYINRINNAMTTLMNQMTAAGYNVRQQAGQFTGISRSIAGASEESINGLAAGINTQNFYISYVPTISQNVASILAVLGGSPTSPNAAPNAEEGPSYEDQMLGYMSSYLPQMHDDVYAVRTLLERVIKPVGTTATHYVAVR